ncbi:MAG TPA: IPT/TIG domain-containing protein [Terriglobales bacterium]|nr:IPT/TIG domain-containing protein [Terriglobales bacterium]
MMALDLKTSRNGGPHIDGVEPHFALPGGEVRITGSHLRPPEQKQPTVRFGELEAPVVISADQFLITRVPDEAASGPLTVSTDGSHSNPIDFRVAAPLSENLHPVANPAVDRDGNVYVTFSGTRGQKVPVAIYKIDTSLNVRPYVVEMMNATGLALDADGYLYVSSRNDGTVYRVAQNGAISTYAEGMGVATGITFDYDMNLYVGDRSGTIFKISRDRQIYVYATLEPSVSAYHMAFGPNGNLFVTGPTTSSFDAIYEVDSHGTVHTFFRGLGRPQGLAFDMDGNLYVAASLKGKRGIVKVTPEKHASLIVAGQNLVGLAFAPNQSAVLATTSGVYQLAWGIAGRPLVS